MDIKKETFKLHEKHKGKIEIVSKVKLRDKEDLALAYTPGVAEISKAIAENKAKINLYTARQNSIAIITDGTAVLGLGDVGVEASLPVMEGKSILFKELGEVDAYPILIDTKDTEEIIKTAKLISKGFGGINLEDISAPRCFEIEERLNRELDIPVFHDDQHGTAIVVLAGLINAIKITKKSKDAKIIINGAGAAGIAIGKLILKYGFRNITMIDSKGIINSSRKDLNKYKQEFASLTDSTGELKDAIKGADIFIGVSKADLLKEDMIKSMAKNPIVFALANPNPEIMPIPAKNAGARVVATGRSDFSNQINNALVFPGLFRGVLDNGIKDITDDLKIKIAETLAKIVGESLNENYIIPDVFDRKVVREIGNTIKKYGKKIGS
jgi:malate dehydrogenase (oxaloacetate-decarboxylating)